MLDYKREILLRETFIQVLESMEYDKFIDHVLFGHVSEQMKERGFDHRL